MALVYFGLGSNLGDKKNNLQRAAAEIEKQIGNMEALSAFYEFEPWGFNSKNTFLNACLAVQTALSPTECLCSINAIEKAIGRTQKTLEYYSDRIVDIDILFYEDFIMNESTLHIPHPLLHQRAFVLIPLSEIAPTLIHPVIKKSVKDLLQEITGLS